MKKNVFALSVAVALAGLAGAANAQEVPFVNGDGTNTTTATKFVVNPDGIGHIQLVPYFTSQGSNNTLLNIVNTDTDNGKAVKVRFRGARNSDDVFDFYVFLSPGDVWRARVYRDGEDTKLESADNSCTWPLGFAADGGTAFPTARVYKQLPSEVREGYIEILTAADIPKNADKDSFYTAIKHVNGVAPCGEEAIAAAMQPLTTADEAGKVGLANPSTGLIAQWAISNVVTRATTSGVATTLLAVDNNDKAALGNIVIAPQSDDLAPAAWSTVGDIANGTADPLFAGKATAYFDYPDLSTPYLTTSTSPTAQANHVSAALAVTEVINEFATVDADLQTDWVIALPTRRYGATIDYTANSGKGAIIANAGNAYFGGLNTAANLTSVNDVPAISINVGTSYWDDEETAAGGNVIVSPGTAVTASLRGEVNVYSFNKAPEESLLGGLISAQRINTTKGNNKAPVNAGWAKLALKSAGTVPVGTADGLPVIGYASIGSAGNAMSFTWPHRYNRAVK